jgi:hypothetical protein
MADDCRWWLPPPTPTAALSTLLYRYRYCMSLSPAFYRLLPFVKFNCVVDRYSLSSFGMRNICSSILALSLVSLAVLSFAQALATGPRTTHNKGTTPRSTEGLGRREWIRQGLVSTGVIVATGGVSLVSDCPPAWGEESPLVSSSPERDALLRAINARAGEETVLKCIDDLIAAQSNTKTKSSSSSSSSSSLTDRIDGQWRLIWSIKDDKFSPLLQLPGPLKPTSYQYAGSAAAPIVGEGRIVQMLTNGILGPTKTWLSSDIVEYKSDSDSTTSSSTLQIRPPFRLELESPFTPNRQVLVDAGSDADFRAANVRTVEAQLAPPNLYEQLYVEEQGSGSLRISKIIEGDPVIVGATFVHVKL